MSYFLIYHCKLYGGNYICARDIYLLNTHNYLNITSVMGLTKRNNKPKEHHISEHEEKKQHTTSSHDSKSHDSSKDSTHTSPTTSDIADTVTPTTTVQTGNLQSDNVQTNVPSNVQTNVTGNVQTGVQDVPNVQTNDTAITQIPAIENNNTTAMPSSSTNNNTLQPDMASYSDKTFSSASNNKVQMEPAIIVFIAAVAFIVLVLLVIWIVKRLNLRRKLKTQNSSVWSSTGFSIFESQVSVKYPSNITCKSYI